MRHGAIAHNPVWDFRPISCDHRQARALTPAEASDLHARLVADATATRLDLPDLVQFMLGSGVRIGEAAAVRASVLDVAAGTVHINATVIRVPGRGLQIQPHTKTIASQRILALPTPVLDMLRGRLSGGRQTGQESCFPPRPAGCVTRRTPRPTYAQPSTVLATPG